MSQALISAALVLVICPAIAALGIFTCFWLEDRYGSLLVSVGVPYVLVVGLCMLIAWPLSVWL